jgi:hypothetical protein
MINRVYETLPGTGLVEFAYVDGNEALAALDYPMHMDPQRHGIIRVHPGSVRLVIDSQFFHEESKNVNEYDSSEKKYTWHWKWMRVPEGQCSYAVPVSLQAGHTYVVNFTYHRSGVCAATCLEQAVVKQVGTILSVACPRPTEPPRPG